MRFLVIVDMQVDFINGSLGTEEAVKIVPEVCRLIRQRREEGARLFVTMDTHGRDYLFTQEGKNLPVEHCIRGTDGWALDSRVKAELGGDAEVFEKPCFGSEALAQRIGELAGPGDEVELCGLCTDICVVSNALLIKAHCPELPVSVREDCCAGVTPEKHQAALETMRSCQVKVVGPA